MIYLFDRLYLDTDQYIKNDKSAMAVLLGKIATDAKNDAALTYDFAKVQCDESVQDNDLASYLSNLLANSDGRKVVIYTDSDMLLRILAFYCASVFENPSNDFIKKLILSDISYFEHNPIYHHHRDVNLRHLGFPTISKSNLDSIIEQATCIEPKLTAFNEIRVEYTFGAYLNGSLPYSQKEILENKMDAFVCATWWLGDQYKDIWPMYLTLAHKNGLDLDNFTINELIENLHNYSKIFNRGMKGTPEIYNSLTLADQLNFIKQYENDFKINVPQYWKDLLTTHLYKDRKKFIKEFVLNGNNSGKFFAAMSMRVMEKANPFLWYAIAGNSDNQEFMQNFVLNL